jgi:hypothetical protein
VNPEPPPPPKNRQSPSPKTATTKGEIAVTSIAQPHDERFDEAEADVDHGAAWMYREPDAPNPMTILATRWSTGVTKLGEAEFLQGTDRDGKRWSILVGSVVLTKLLIDGIFEAWDDDVRGFVVVQTLGRVEPGEVVSVLFKGDREGAKYNYPDFSVSRKPAKPTSDTRESSADSDIPF